MIVPGGGELPELGGEVEAAWELTGEEKRNEEARQVDFRAG